MLLIGALEKMIQRRRQRKAVHDSIQTVADFLPRTEHGRTLRVMLIPEGQGGALTASALHPSLQAASAVSCPGRQDCQSVCLCSLEGSLLHLVTLADSIRLIRLQTLSTQHRACRKGS